MYVIYLIPRPGEKAAEKEQFTVTSGGCGPCDEDEKQNGFCFECTMGKCNQPEPKSINNAYRKISNFLFMAVSSIYVVLLV